MATTYTPKYIVKGGATEVSLWDRDRGDSLLMLRAQHVQNHARRFEQAQAPFYDGARTSKIWKAPVTFSHVIEVMTTDHDTFITKLQALETVLDGDSNNFFQFYENSGNYWDDCKVVRYDHRGSRAAFEYRDGYPKIQISFTAFNPTIDGGSSSASNIFGNVAVTLSDYAIIRDGNGDIIFKLNEADGLLELTKPVAVRASISEP